MVVSSTPSGKAHDADVRIELGDLARGQHDLVDADVGDAARRRRLRFERSSTSKSASRSSPPMPSCAIVDTTARPTDSPATATHSPASRSCSSSVMA